MDMRPAELPIYKLLHIWRKPTFFRVEMMWCISLFLVEHPPSCGLVLISVLIATSLVVATVSLKYLSTIIHRGGVIAVTDIAAGTDWAAWQVVIHLSEMEYAEMLNTLLPKYEHND